MRKLRSVLTVALTGAIVLSAAGCSFGGKLTKSNFEKAAKALGAEMFYSYDDMVDFDEKWHEEHSFDEPYDIKVFFHTDDKKEIDYEENDLLFTEFLDPDADPEDYFKKITEYSYYGFTQKDEDGRFIRTEVFLYTLEDEDTAKALYNDADTDDWDDLASETGGKTEHGKDGYEYQLLCYDEDPGYYTRGGVYLQGKNVMVLIQLGTMKGSGDWDADAFCKEMGVKSPEDIDG